MQLIRLSIYKNNEVIRNIAFRRGLNLIVNTISKSGSTGNSVGKSTVSRLLDYIFMSSGEDIYTDTEFGKVIPAVYNFINENTILVELDFNGFDQRKYKVGRTLKVNSKESIFSIDSRLVDKGTYLELISKQLFGQSSEKPSIRNLAHKFIRNTNEKMQKTIRFLHGNTKPDIYDQLYLFLFGFSGLDLLKEKAELNNKISTKVKHLAAYRNPHRESVLQKMLVPLRAEEEELKNKISEFDFSGSQDSSVKELVQIQNKISEYTIRYSQVKTRLDYLERSISKLRENATNVDGRELSLIYADAGVSISNVLKRSFEDLVVFHNRVISKKVDLLKNDFQDYVDEETRLSQELDLLHKDETQILRNINEPDAFKSIAILYNELSKIKEQIAGNAALLNQIESTKQEIELLDGSKAIIIKEISLNTAELDKNIALFNIHFGELSKFFYGDRYIFDLEFDIESERCRFDIANIAPNPTGGKKKGELSAFDLAYIQFVKSTQIKRPSFVIHDSIEDVDVNQIFDIFQKANQLNGQYIVALLSDKLTDPRFNALKENSIILELSESDKFFRI